MRREMERERERESERETERASEGEREREKKRKKERGMGARSCSVSRASDPRSTGPGARYPRWAPVGVLASYLTSLIRSALRCSDHITCRVVLVNSIERG